MISLRSSTLEQLPLFHQPDLLHSTLEAKQRKPRRSKPEGVGTELLKWLDIPMFDAHGLPTAEAVILDSMLDAPEAIDVFAEAEEDQEKLSWSNESVCQLHSVLLENSLKALAGRGNPTQKMEILDWIFEPDFVGTVQRNGRDVPVYSDHVPFTFAFCCKLERMNPEVIQDFLLSVMPAAVKHHYQ